MEGALITRPLVAKLRWPTREELAPYAIWGILALGLIIRMYLARDPGHEADLRTLEDFSSDLANGGPFNFYEGPNFKDYLPGYLYYLWGIGLAGKWIGFGHDTTFWLLKFPSIFADRGHHRAVRREHVHGVRQRLLCRLRQRLTTRPSTRFSPPMVGKWWFSAAKGQVVGARRRPNSYLQWP